ncbi:MAG: site-2 protease family protein [Limnobacter sp.]|nr:site-2 protease family protein [Limnobacter sp.]
MDYEVIQTFAVYALPVLFAITLHEAAHGYMALRCGDKTAFLAGRITVNPIKHIDPFGTIALPLLMYFTTQGAFLFGWARPVPVDFSRLNKPKRDIRYVAFAGPGANILMALLWAAFLKAQVVFGVSEPFFFEMAKAGINVNLVLAALNLLPILPLDGGRILFSYLPARAAFNFSKTEPYGMIVLIALVVTNILPMFIRPFLIVGYGALTTLFNL